MSHRPLPVRGPPPHPEPPADPATLQLSIATVPGPLYRIHASSRDPIHFGTEPRHRFDAPAGELGVLYAGLDAYAAFVETFGHATGVRAVTETELRHRTLARLDLNRPLAVADVTGPALARLGADLRLTCGDDYLLARRWSLALARHPAAVDGLLYTARHDSQRQCIAVFDRASDALEPAAALGTLLDRPNAKLLAQILDAYGFGLIP